MENNNDIRLNFYCLLFSTIYGVRLGQNIDYYVLKTDLKNVENRRHASVPCKTRKSNELFCYIVNAVNTPGGGFLYALTWQRCIRFRTQCTAEIDNVRDPYIYGPFRGLSSVVYSRSPCLPPQLTVPI